MIRRLPALWPRRAPGLPPGQGRLPRAPRFSARPRVGPPHVGPDHILRIGPRRGEQVELALDDLRAVGAIERTHALHCVTTWSAVGLRWTGVPLVDVWEARVAPELGAAATAPFAVAVGADRYRTVFVRDDLLHPDVLLAWGLDGRPLDARHGGPLRLVSPHQYGYKNAKHLATLELWEEQPPGRMGAKEHLRARVALEERHSRLPGRPLRLPYRLTVAPTALLAERSLAATRSGRDRDRPAGD